jgi:hypothetical protein
MQLFGLPEHVRQLELQLWQIEVEVSAYLPAGHPVDNTQVKVDDIRKY